MSIIQQELREAVRGLCARFGESYWQALDRERAYPEAFVRELTEAGYLACLIPEDYGGAGLGLTEACVVMEEINRSGANAAACHAQMYTMGTLLRHGSEEQKRRWLPGIAAGELRLRRSRSRNRTRAPTRPGSRRSPSGAATATS